MNASFYASSKGRLLFSIRGRIPRTDFWVGFVAIVGIATLAILLNGNRVRGGTLGEFFAAVTTIAALSPFCLIALSVKRLHDIDTSGWYALALIVPFLFGALAALAYGSLREGPANDEWRDFWTLTSYVTAGLAAASLAFFIGMVGCIRGTSGANRFGPDPLGSG